MKHGDQRWEQCTWLSRTSFSSLEAVDWFCYLPPPQIALGDPVPTVPTLPCGDRSTVLLSRQGGRGSGRLSQATQPVVKGQGESLLIPKAHALDFTVSQSYSSHPHASPSPLRSQQAGKPVSCLRLSHLARKRHLKSARHHESFRFLISNMESLRLREVKCFALEYTAALGKA